MSRDGGLSLSDLYAILNPLPSIALPLGVLTELVAGASSQTSRRMGAAVQRIEILSFTRSSTNCQRLVLV